MRVFNYLKKASVVAAGALVLILPLARQSKADLFDQRTVVTFSGAVAIPGQVLSAGTYVFKVSPVPPERDVIQIFNADGMRLISTQLTIPVYLERAPDHSMVTLGESPAGKPPIVHQFVYAGMSYGHQFVYKH